MSSQKINILQYTNPNLKTFWVTPQSTIRQTRYRVLYGGRGSSKSHEFATFLVFLMSNFSIRVLCARAFQNKIEESVYSLIRTKTETMGISKQFSFLKSSIEHKTTGAKAVFYGLNRNIDEIKSLENISICWVEEANFITEEQFNILIPTIRGKNSEVWLSFNPREKSDYIYKRFILNSPGNAIVRKINYTDNPYCPDVIKQEALAMQLKDEKLFEYIYLGKVLNDDTNKFFKSLSSFSHRLKSYNRIYIGFDVADGGTDPHAIIIETDNTIVDIIEIYGDFEKGVSSLIKLVNKYIPMRKEIIIIYDAIGVGAGVETSLKGKISPQVKIVPFKASNKVINPRRKEILPYPNQEAYYNLKAQIWHIMGYETKQIKHQEIKLIDRLTEQLEVPLITYSSNKILVEKKKDLLKRGIPSPNLADAYICILYAKYIQKS